MRGARANGDIGRMPELVHNAIYTDLFGLAVALWACPGALERTVSGLVNLRG